MATGQLELRWLASSSASALHAAACVFQGLELVEAKLAQELAEPARSLHEIFKSLGKWGPVLALSAGIESNRELAEVAIRKIRGAGAVDTHRDRLAAAIGDVERVFRSHFPKCAEEVALRGRPLREQWEARGPGLLRNLADLTEPELLVQQADVVLLQPVVGGFARAFPSQNSVHIEAVLANPISELPEVVRLAWLLGQLNLDLPRFTERVNRPSSASRLAMVPAVLQAAQYVELATFDETNLQRALEMWCSPGGQNELTLTLLDWWNTYQESRPPFSIALQALEKMMFVM
jgi:hypothetical protein